MQKEKIIHLYSQHKANALSKQEEQEWWALLEDASQDHLLREVVGTDWDEMDLGNLRSISEVRSNRLLNEIILLPQYKKKRNLYWLPGVAAAAVAVIVFSIMLFDPFASSNADIAPGGNRATLTLADGRTIELSDDHEGILIGIEDIKYPDGTPVRAKNLSPVNTHSSEYLSLTTPPGGQYQITLPDGTKVWLNAATTLKYPSRFVGTERRVELVGEAYFEVSQVLGNRDKGSEGKEKIKTSFIVASANQEVTVLGTHFMVSAYPDESETKTTLAEGSVSVSPILSSSSALSSRATAKDLYAPKRSIILKPNQQAILKDGTLKQINIIADDELAWVGGDFQFNDESLASIMRKMARWYQIEVVFEDNKLKAEAFYGVVSRFDNISKVLNKLEAIGDVRFRLEGNKVFIRRK